MDKKFKIRLNSEDKVEELLQEIYDQANRHINEIQIEMDKLTKVDLSEADVDSMAKYSKSMHDLIGDKAKALQQKMDIAKFMGDIMKHDGDVNATLNDPSVSKKTSLDLKSLRKAGETNDNVQNYDLR